jgi:acyl carrier protein
MIDKKSVMSAIVEFAGQYYPDVPAAELEALRAGDLIDQSMVLVEFVLHLEVRLGVSIDIDELAAELITKPLGYLAETLATRENHGTEPFDETAGRGERDRAQPRA